MTKKRERGKKKMSENERGSEQGRRILGNKERNKVKERWRGKERRKER